MARGSVSEHQRVQSPQNGQTEAKMHHLGSGNINVIAQGHGGLFVKKPTPASLSIHGKHRAAADNYDSLLFIVSPRVRRVFSSSDLVYRHVR